MNIELEALCISDYKDAFNTVMFMTRNNHSKKDEEAKSKFLKHGMSITTIMKNLGLASSSSTEFLLRVINTIIVNVSL